MQAFIERLEQRLKALQAERDFWRTPLGDYLLDNDLLKIISYVLQLAKGNQFVDLKRGRAHRIAKQDSKLARTCSVVNNFECPHKANDMFACGVALHQLYSDRTHPFFIKITNTPIAALLNTSNGLLAPYRENRLDVDGAIGLLKAIMCKISDVTDLKDKTDSVLETKRLKS